MQLSTPHHESSIPALTLKYVANIEFLKHHTPFVAFHTFNFL